MFGGFSTKNGETSFAFPSTPPPPRTPKEWKTTMVEVKRLYLNRQYKQCAARAVELLETIKGTNASVDGLSISPGFDD